jgi:hypothetical protein
MPNWFVIAVVLVAVVPGVVVILAGVVAMFVMPAKADAREQPDAGDTGAGHAAVNRDSVT